jgi:thioredoxin 1
MAMQFTDQNFEDEVLKSEKPVLVDFWAEWCGPCQMMGPIIEELAKELEGKFKIGKLNVDENREIAGKYGIMSIPTLIIFKDGKEAKQLVGLQSKEGLKEELEKI